MNKKIGCVVCDVDGSLIGNNQKISNNDIRTIRQLIDNNIKFFIISGRHQLMCKPLVNSIDRDIYIGCNNGATIYNFKKNNTNLVSNNIFIPKELVNNFWNYCVKNNYMCYVYTKNNAFVNKDYRSKDYSDNLISQIIQGEPSIILDTIEDDFNPLDYDVIKLLVPNIPIDELNELISTVDENNLLEVSYSHTNFAEATMKGINKGMCLKFLSKNYNFDLSNTMAMGDNYNDMPMMKIAKYTVATGNAENDIKEYSDFVTNSCDDSPLTKAIKHFNII